MSTVDESPTASYAEELTVEELSARTGISVRNLRFYTTRGLVPAPTKRGRSAVYGPAHVARFELLQELQAHGLTLAAIERFFEGIPADAPAEQIALQRATLRPLASHESAEVSRAELDARAGRTLDDATVQELVTMGAVTPLEDGRYSLEEGRLRSSLRVMELGVPTDLVVACDEVYRRHAEAMASELEVIFRESLWPAYKSGEMGADQLTAMLANWEEGGTARLVEAFSDAVTEARRALIERRAR